MHLRWSTFDSNILVIFDHITYHAIVSFPWIKSKVGTCEVSKLPLPSNRCWSFFCWQYDKAAPRTAAQSSTQVPMTPFDLSRLKSASLTHNTQFQPSSSCLIGICRSNCRSLSAFSILASTSRTKIICVGIMEIVNSSNTHSEPPAGRTRSRAWYRTPSSSLLSLFGPTNNAQWYLVSCQ